MQLIILRGVPGCGKTTVSNLFHGAQVASADDYAMCEDGGYYWYPELRGYYHSRCRQRVARLMSEKHPMVVVSNTSTTNREVEQWRKMALSCGYIPFVIVVENRHNGKDVHGVPESTLGYMEKNLRESIILR